VVTDLEDRLFMQTKMENGQRFCSLWYIVTMSISGLANEKVLTGWLLVLIELRFSCEIIGTTFVPVYQQRVM
jgi:hypothetical protein